jgi:alkanesulfonate monooxygenase
VTALKVLGLLPYADESELVAAPTAFDASFIRRLAEVYDRHGYHRVLIAQSARSPDSMTVAAHVAAVTERLGFMIAHRPGFVAPTLAARMLATIDQLSGGRCAVHIITATNDVETRADGDFLTKEVRYQRSRSYVDILRRVWAKTAPFDHHDDFYRIEQAGTMVRPVAGSIPIYWGGASELGVRFGGECADVYAFGGTTLASSAALIAQVRTAGAAAGRQPRFLMSIRVVIADTDAAAWERADGIVATLKAKGAAQAGLGSGSDESARKRIADALAARSIDDPALWGGVVEATAGRSHAMALVGGPETLAKALRAYQAIGVDEVLLRGFDNLADAETIGRDLIPLLAR